MAVRWQGGYIVIVCHRLAVVLGHVISRYTGFGEQWNDHAELCITVALLLALPPSAANFAS